MPVSYILIPFLTAFTGWFTVWIIYKFCFYPSKSIKIAGFAIQGIIPAKLPSIQYLLSQFVLREVVNFDEMEKKITDPGLMDNIMPMAEEQIDNFLRNKLKDVFPMIEMFIGEKTINQLKEVFMEELRTLFPAGIKMYIVGLKKNMDTEKMINEKINRALVNTILPAMEKNIWPQLKKTALIAAAFGFFIGMAELALLKFL